MPERRCTLLRLVFVLLWLLLALPQLANAHVGAHAGPHDAQPHAVSSASLPEPMREGSAATSLRSRCPSGGGAGCCCGTWRLAAPPQAEATRGAMSLLPWQAITAA